jgi:N-acetylmuramoyl-L-alanine amidase
VTVGQRLLLFLLVMIFSFSGSMDAGAAQLTAKKKAATAATAKKPAAVKKSAAAKKPVARGKKALTAAPVKPVAAKPAAVIVPQPQSYKSGPLAQSGELRYWSNPDYTRITLSFDRETTFQHNALKPTREAALPDRIYIDIAGAKMGPGTKDIPIGDGLLKMARIGQFQPDVVRLVLDVENIRDFKIFPLSNPFRIVIDVKGERRTELSALPAATIQKIPTAEELYKTSDTRQPEARPLRPSPIRRIVVDPGHGGRDPGAVGANGTQEKDVVLSIGLRLAELLRHQLGVEVLMTRSSDVFIPLEERTAIANKLNADLFISIHANAAVNREASGLETYYLNLAKTEKAAQLAARENGTSLDKVSVLQAILFDLMANYKLNDSAHLAEEVQKSVFRRLSSSYAGIKNLGVKQGPFYVLVGATMPSILVETAFLSNAVEEEHLNDPEFLNTAAAGILDGVRAYVAGLK